MQPSASFPPVVRAFSAVGLVFLLIAALHSAAGVVVPVVEAIVVWFVLNALANWLRRLPVIGRHLPGWAALVVSALAAFALAFLVVQASIGSVGQIAAQAAGFRQLLDPFAAWIAGRFGIDDTELLRRVLSGLRIETLATTVVSATASTISHFSIVAIYVGFMLVDQQFLAAKFALLVPDPARRARAQLLIRRLVAAIHGYLQVMTLSSALTSVACYLVLRLVGLDSAAFWGVAIFFLNFIPTVGSIVGTVLPVAFVLLQFQAFWPFAFALAGIGAAQFLVGNVFMPRLAGDRLNVSLFVVLFSLFAFRALWGLTGMFVAMPLTAMLVITLGSFEATRPIAVILSRTGDVLDPPPDDSGLGDGA